MTKKEFKEIVQEGKNRAYELWNDDYDLYQGKLQDYILRLFNHREFEAQEVLWEHEIYRVNKKDPELHAYWKKQYATYAAVNHYTKHLQREIAYWNRLEQIYQVEWNKEV